MDLEATVTAMAPSLLRYCIGVCGDRSAGEDTAQEALTVLVAHWQREGAPDSPRALAYTVARRRMARWRWRRRLMRPLEALLEARHPAPGPDLLASQRETLDAVLAALSRLSTRDREALLLVMDGDLSSEEAAQLLGVGRSAFKMRVHRARQRLARVLESKHGIQQTAIVD
jgi:RNA polymerase sigma-70 factor (ECF subfamily)